MLQMLSEYFSWKTWFACSLLPFSDGRGRWQAALVIWPPKSVKELGLQETGISARSIYNPLAGKCPQDT